MNILEMKLAAAGKLAKMSALVKTAEGENRDLTEQEQASYDGFKQERATINARIERAEELEREESAQGKLDGQPRKPDTQGKASTDPTETKEYQEAFASIVRSRRNSVANDVRAALQIGSQDGHFAVPQKYRTEMIRKLSTQNCLRQIANVITTTSTENIPIVTDNGAAGWVDELAAYPESDISGDRKVLGAHKLGRICKISEELLQDQAVNLESVLSDAYAKSFAAAEEAGFWKGDGTKKPTGLETQVTKSVTAATATKITYDDLIDVQHSIKQVYRESGVWVMNDLTVALVRKLKNTQGEPIWQDTLRNGEPAMLLGKPVYCSDAIDVPAASKVSVFFGDFKSGVDIGDRGAIEMQRLEELYAANGAIGFRMHSRVDCILKDADAVAKLVHPAAK